MTYLSKKHDNYKESVDLVASENVDIASPGNEFDGYVVSSGARILLRAQSNAAQNGIYVWHGSTVPMTRPPDADTAQKIRQGSIIPVELGDTFGGKLFVIESSVEVLGVDSLIVGALNSPDYSQENSPAIVGLTGDGGINFTVTRPSLSITKLGLSITAAGLGGAPIEWSPDGRFLVTGADGEFSPALYEWSGDKLYKLPFSADLPADIHHTARWSQNGQFLAIGHYASPFVNVYERTGTSFTKLSNLSPLPSDSIRHLGWSPDSRFLTVAWESFDDAKTLMSTYERTGTSFTRVDHTEIYPTMDRSIAGVEWSPDGRILLVAVGTTIAADRILLYARTNQTLTKLAALDPVLPGGCRDAKWSPDGRLLALSHANSPYLTVYEREGTTLTKLSDLSGVDSTLHFLNWSPDGRYLIGTTSSDPDVFIRFGGGLVQRTDFVSPFTGNRQIRWSPDGRLIARSFNSSPYVEIYSVSQGTLEGPAYPINIQE